MKIRNNTSPAKFYMDYFTCNYRLTKLKIKPSFTFKSIETSCTSLFQSLSTIHLMIQQKLLFATAVLLNAPVALLRKILVLLNLSTELLKEIAVPIFCRGKYAQNYSSSSKCSSKLTQENIGTPEPFSRAPKGNSSANILSREIRSRQQQHYYFFQKSPTLKKS